MSKFKVGDHVRVTNPLRDELDRTGVVTGDAEIQCEPASTVMFDRTDREFIFRHTSLTLADPDVHTVLDQMDTESAPVDPELYSGPVTATVYPTDQMDAESALPQADLEPHFAAIKKSQAEWDAMVTPDPVNRRAQVLRTAESLVNGQRADDYGPPQENFGRVAAMWSAQFAAKLKEPLTADEVAIALVHLKLSRLANTPDHADSFIDAAGYIALAAEIAEAAQ